MPGKEPELQLWKGTSCDGERKKSPSSISSHTIHPPSSFVRLWPILSLPSVSRFLLLLLLFPVGNSSYDSLESNKLGAFERHNYM